MKNSRRKHTSGFKMKVVLEALKERMTLSELAKKYEIHASQISTWKQEFKNNAAGVFDQVKTKKKDKTKDDIEVEKLYAKIGRLEMENDYLKKSLAKLD